MLEGVLKAQLFLCRRKCVIVSILGMLEGVLKARELFGPGTKSGGFNPWYVGGGVKRPQQVAVSAAKKSFNPWYVGGGVKSHLSRR